VRTGGSTIYGHYAAVINGTINPRGVPTVYEFDLQSSEDRMAGSIFASHPINPFAPFLISDRSVHHLSWSLNEADGIGPDDSYYYRLVAINRNGIFNGDWHEFTMSWAPCSQCVGVTNLVYVPVDQSTVTATLSLNPALLGGASDARAAAGATKALVLGSVRLHGVRRGDLRVHVPLSAAARRRLASHRSRLLRNAQLTIVVTPPPHSQGQPIVIHRRATVVLRQSPKPKPAPRRHRRH
jgi:hypothetical protein